MDPRFTLQTAVIFALTGACLHADTTPPVWIVPPQDWQVVSDGAGNTAQFAAWLQSHAGAAAIDETSAVVISNDYLPGGGAGGALSIPVQFTATDAAGNTVQATATFSTSLPLDVHGMTLTEWIPDSAPEYAILTDAVIGHIGVNAPGGFHGADLTGVRIGWGEITVSGQGLTGLQARAARFENVKFTLNGPGGAPAALSGADFRDTLWAGCAVKSSAGTSWSGVNLSGAVFRCADLRHAGDLGAASFSAASPPRYDEHTHFPAGFDPVAAGWQLMPPGPLELETVALRNDPAAGLAGVLHLGFNRTAIGNPGRVGFLGTLTGSGVVPENASSLWRELPGAGPALVAREGNAVPDDPPAVYSVFRNIWFREDGAVTFDVTLAGAGITTANDRAFFHKAPDIAGHAAPNALRQIARDGAAFDGVPGTQISTWALPAYSGSVLAMQGRLAAGGDVTTLNDTFLAQRTLDAAGASEWEIIAREGAATGVGSLPAATVFADIRPRAALSYGSLVFSATLRSGGVTSLNNIALFARTAEGLAMQARASQNVSVPGTPSVLRNFLAESVSATQGTAFLASLRGADGVLPPAETANALFRLPSGGSPVCIVRQGQSAGSAGEVFADINNPHLAGSGDIFFGAVLSGPAVTAANDLSFWRARPDGTLEMLAREGDAAPGLPGVLIGTLTSVAAGPAGHYAMLATLTNADGTLPAAQNAALWLSHGDSAGWQLVLRKGDPISPVPGTAKTVTNLLLSGVSPGGTLSPAAPCVNMTGEVSFIATWAGGSGVFVARTPLDCDPPVIDDDGDGLPDDWELDHGLDPTDSTDAAADSDGDGLSATEEIAAGADPRAADTDSDGVLDAAEIALGTQPGASTAAAEPEHPVTGLKVHYPLRRSAIP